MFGIVHRAAGIDAVALVGLFHHQVQADGWNRRLVDSVRLQDEDDGGDTVPVGFAFVARVTGVKKDVGHRWVVEQPLPKGAYVGAIRLLGAGVDARDIFENLADAFLS